MTAGSALAPLYLLGGSVHLHSYENLTVIKAAAAAGPAVNAHFDSHCVEIGVSNFM